MPQTTKAMNEETMSSSKRKPPHRHTRIWLIPLVAAFVSLACFLAMNILQKWPGKDVGASDIFCESNYRQWTVKQPVNTVSSLVFVLAGLGIALYSRDLHWKGSNLLCQSPGLLILYSLTLVSIGVGSMFYHATGTAWSGTWDVVAQLPYASFLCVYSFIRLLTSLGKLQQSRESSTFWWLYVTTTLVVSIPRLLVDIEYAGPIAGLIVAFLLLEWKRYCHEHKNRHSRRYLVSALVCILLGYTVLLLSTTGAKWCRPRSLLQGHALWHLLSAASTALVFLYFVTADRDCHGDSVVMVDDKDSTESLIG